MTELVYQIKEKLSIYLTDENLIILLLVFLFIILLRLYLYYLVKKQKYKSIVNGTRINKIIFGITSKIKFSLILSIVFCIVLLNLIDNSSIHKFVTVALKVIITVQATLLLQEGIRIFFKTYREERYKEHPELKSLYDFVSKFVIVLVWIIAVLLLLSNIGYNINSLITSLGIGGIAIALAVQNILKDIFSGFIILVTQPFQVNDFIKLAEDQKGNVTKIGFKNTTIKTIEGEELLIPNDDILNSRVYNYSSRKKRRESFKIYVDLETTTEKISILKNEILNLVKKEEKIEKEDFRVILDNISESALVFEVVYYMINDDFDDYINTKDKLNTMIKTIFEENNIKFANTISCLTDNS